MLPAMLLILSGYGQVAVNSDGTGPDNSAMLDVKSSNKGLLVPRLNTLQRTGISSPAEGLLVYDTDMGAFYYRHAGAWIIMVASSTNWQIGGNTGTNPSANFIGTVDNIPLVFRVNNLEAGRIDQVNSNVSLGYQAFRNNFYGTGNSAFGNKALYSSTEGNFNTAIGMEAEYLIGEGSSNTAVGAYALHDNMDASFNTAVGVNALHVNMNGYNTATGTDALFNNYSGHHNTANGYRALYVNQGGSNNTAHGSTALYNNTSGTDNVAIGEQALNSNLEGNNNTALGKAALDQNQYGSSNTALGAFTNTGAVDMDNTTTVGYGAVATASNQVRLGNGFVTSLYCQGAFESTTTYQANLRVNPDGQIVRTTEFPYWNIAGNRETNPEVHFIGTTDNTRLDFRVRNQQAVTIQTDGRVGIGTAAPLPSAKLEIVSTDQGFLPPRMSMAQRLGITIPAVGLLVYQTDGQPGYYYYTGTNWVGLTSNTVAGSTVSCIDYDGNAYPTITIGTQTWMAENLRVTRYRNGVAIPIVIDWEAWAGCTAGAYCWYDNDPVASGAYGTLYNYFAVADSRGLCPTGWHVPSDADWNVLFNALGGADVAGGKMKVDGGFFWNSPNSYASNSSGFSAISGGLRWGSEPHPSVSPGEFISNGKMVEMWTSSGHDCFLQYNWQSVQIMGGHSNNGQYVRCLRD